MSIRVSIQQYLICIWVLGAMMPPVSRAEIDFFQMPAEQKRSITKESWATTRGTKIAKVLFFLAPGCWLCPEQATKIQKELSRLGWQYDIEGIFRGNPIQVGKYLAELRNYPFNFEIGLDMDGKLAKQYQVTSFPTAVIDVAGKRINVTKASELEDRLK
jgi:hypothetical protein